jgi:predicted ATPase
MPLISVSGTQCVGKTTFIKDFLAQWPMYKTADKTYRDVIRSEKLKINKETTQESQKLILEAIVEDINLASKDEFILFDRSPIDNLVYSLWAYDKNVGDIDDGFVADCIKIARQAIKKLDIMLLIPLTKHHQIKIEESEQRETDPVYRKEIDELFQGLKRKREADDDVFFVKDDSPPFIEVFGSREARIAMCQLYIREDGEFYGEEDSMLLDDVGDVITKDADLK